MRKSRILGLIENIFAAFGFIMMVWISLSIFNFVINDPLCPNIWSWNFFKILIDIREMLV